ncbi:MAG: preprotein translocase subunit SecE [Deltaproteobacteria bacterium]|nr:preprotein translocase subunit SecE [Deltaproteobacteria bacterium]MBW2082356.1 preprotein translocase subunit SecE [Deltaproteobacteria bacterium]HDM10390.1 preprotein translocase subunit SecE [Desulfobacteraceae bacterium]
MKKANQRAKKRKRSKKNPVTQTAKKEQKKVSPGPKSEKAVVSSKPVNNVPKRVQEKKTNRGKEGKGVGHYISKSIQFLRESRTELKKVKWPNRRELLVSTGVVIFLVLVVALFLGIVDFGLIKVIKNIVG